MAPKRKRAQDPHTVAESTRATRSSTRTTQNHSEPASSKRANKKVVSKPTTASDGRATAKEIGWAEEHGDTETVPMIKKSKTTKAAKTTQAKSKSTAPYDDEANSAQRQCTPNHDEGGPSVSVPITKNSIQPKTDVHPPNEPYTPARALTLFQVYADCDEPDVIGPEGFTQLCNDAQIPMDGSLPLILAWQLGATEMGKFTKDQWVAGLRTLQISSLAQLATAVADLERLLILHEEPVKSLSGSSTKGKRPSSAKNDDPYDKMLYRTYASNRKDAFAKLYLFCFALAKPPQVRNIDMETATAFWSVLLAPQYTIMGEVVKFINEKGTHKGANKDLWNMMLEFCQTVKPTLEDYEADGAWPTLLDDFVSWKKSKMANGETSIGTSNGQE